MIPADINEIKLISVEFVQQATKDRQERYLFLHNEMRNEKAEIHEPVYLQCVQRRWKDMYKIILVNCLYSFNFE